MPAKEITYLACIAFSIIIFLISGYDGGFNSCGGDTIAPILSTLSLILLIVFLKNGISIYANGFWRIIASIILIAIWLSSGYIAGIVGFASFLVSNGEHENIFEAFHDPFLLNGC